MQWITSVPEALSSARSLQTPLLVLVEPPSAVQERQDFANETVEQLHSRVATNALHRHLFSNSTILQIVRLTNLRCLRFPCENTNKDFLSFSAFFVVDLPPPNLFIINPSTGAVLNRFKGYVSPLSFRDAISNAMKTVSKSNAILPEISRKNAFESNIIQPKSPPTQLASSGSATAGVSAISNKASPKPATKLTDVPATSSTSSLKMPKGYLSCQLRCRLLDGRQVEREFKSDVKFGTVRSWLAEETRRIPSHLTVATSFPRYVFSLADDSKLLSELSLCPSSTLTVSPAPTDAGIQTADAPTTQHTRGDDQPWRLLTFASDAASILSSLVRSSIFGTEQIVPQTNAGDTERPLNGSATGSHPDGPRAVRMTERRNSRDGSDEGQWMSNGNSTQFGWNAKDEEDDHH